MTSRRIVLILAAGLLASLYALGPALGHSEIESTDPASGSHLDKVPPQIVLTMTEDPGQGSFIKAVDGCGDKVLGNTTESGAELVFEPSGGATGKWKVTFKAISAEDGHVTHGDFSFAVAGKPDCSKGGDKVGGGENTRVTNPNDGGSSFPILPVVIGAAILVVLALVLRRSASR